MYCTGQGVPKDFAQAVRWYELAAELGHDSPNTISGSCC